jgi:crotonobetainyl-CoA:carnitine CoA-transferase CaiB-like acyl-CoA transferase
MIDKNQPTDAGIFAGLRVLELASVLAGPSVGLFFAELGAEVIKIENATTGGDVTRTWRSATERKDTAASAYYASANWNKETHFLDLSQQKSLEFIYNLLPTTDIVVANFKKSAATRMGVAAEQLRAAYPSLIYANISGFGSDDARVAFDVVLQAESGFMYMNGQADSEATKMPVALIDILAAHQLKEGILTALYRRSRTGKGATVEVSLLDSAVASLANQASTYLMTGAVPQRIGSLHPNIAPYGELLAAADGTKYVLAIGSDRQFEQLCALLSLSDLPKLADYSSNQARVKNRKQLAETLQKAFNDCQSEAFYTACIAENVPIGRVRNLAEVFELPAADALIRSQNETDGTVSRRVSTAIFKLH